MKDFENRLRYLPGTRRGHYESYFMRANHPEEPNRAFWLRYTLFVPKGLPQIGRGELWAIYFEGNRHTAAKLEVPIELCYLPGDLFQMEMGGCTLMDGRAVGHIREEFRWNLNWTCTEKPLLLMPQGWYSAALPKAKSLVPRPLARFDGHLILPDRTIDVKGWTGSQNHNWGSRHTDEYAWGQVMGFDNAPNTVLEMGTGRIHMGKLRSPRLTAAVLRHEGRDYTFNGWLRGFLAKADYDYFRWEVQTETVEASLHVRISAPRSAFVALRYANPPGGSKCCLNSKIARCEVVLEDKKTKTQHRFLSESRCAFEILTDDKTEHGLPVLF